MERRTVLIVGGLILLIVICICLIVALAAGAIFTITESSVSTVRPQFNPALPTPTDLPVRPIEKPNSAAAPVESLMILENTRVPESNLLDLARRLAGKPDIPASLAPPSAPHVIGAQQTFWVSNVDTNESFQVDATLQSVTDSLYFWIEDGVRFDPNALADLASAFDRQIYPTTRAFFGSEWNPGVDGDPRLYIIYTTGVGDSIAGYFSSADEYLPQAHKYSNAHEMFILNADNLALDEQFTYAVLAHEFQHMIHWNQDRNEDSWMNEGFSELASYINGYGADYSDRLYAANTDLQLTYWPVGGNTVPHYGAAFLFLSYFLDRFGEEATRTLASHPANGLTGVDEVLEGLDLPQPLTADDLFTDWAVANYLASSGLADDRFVYDLYADAPQAQPTEEITDCPLGERRFNVHQYGVDYVRISCRGVYNLRFSGEKSVNLLPVNALSGDYAFWSNRGDESDMTLTRQFDFSAVQGRLTLNYWTWFDLEKDYDYVYVLASTDGERWDILPTPSGTLQNPSGNSFGHAYNGKSGRWIQESADISAYAGQKVWLRFEYVTDAAAHAEGFLVDDISIPETGYFTDFENNEDGWVGEGFVRVQNLLPQSFRLSLITIGETTGIQYIPLKNGNSVEVSLDLSGDFREAVLVVSGITRHTQQLAGYTLSIERQTP